MIVVFRYHHRYRLVEHSVPMNWDEPYGDMLPTPVALTKMQSLYGKENVTVEIFHPHLHGRHSLLDTGW